MRLAFFIIFMITLICFGADKKFSDLPYLPQSQWSGIDIFAISDISSATSKRTTVADFDARFGTVSSVALVAPSIFIVSGSPIVSTGTFTIGLVSQTANTFWAGPTAGTSVPTFRILDALDIPNLSASKITTGILPSDRGGTSFGTYTTGDLLVGSGTTLRKLPIGSTNQVLTAIGGTAAWAAPSTSTVSAPTSQNFTTAGTFTYTAPTDLKYIQVTTIGGGGGGGQSGVSASTGGGAAGGISVSILTAAQIGVSQSLTVGAGGSPNNTGGTTSFGSFLSATGGTQGSDNKGGIGGIAGIGSSGTVMVGIGGPGYTGTTYAGVGNFGGEGGSNAYGGGGRGVTGAVGNNGRGCGGGGSGHGDPNTAGSGSAGCVLIQEYY